MDKKTIALTLIVLAVIFAVIGAVSLSSQPSSTVLIERTNTITPPASNQVQLEVQAPEAERLPSS